MLPLGDPALSWPPGLPGPPAMSAELRALHAPPTACRGISHKQAKGIRHHGVKQAEGISHHGVKQAEGINHHGVTQAEEISHGEARKPGA